MPGEHSPRAIGAEVGEVCSHLPSPGGVHPCYLLGETDVELLRFLLNQIL